jgi:hypothetical protein
VSYLRVAKVFSCDLRIGLRRRLARVFEWCFDRDSSTLTPTLIGGQVQAQSMQSGRAPRRATPKVSCDQCFFSVNLLCALELDEPCSTYRPAEAKLKPPPQLRLVFRHERRTRAAWAFPSAQEQASLHV